MGPDPPVAAEHRVLLLAPTRRDALICRTLLERSGLGVTACENAGRVAGEVEQGAGAILLTDAAFRDAGMAELLAALGRQPAWSDVPLILLCRAGGEAGASIVPRALRNVTVLDRPTSTRTLLSSVQAALRARTRQYQLREQLRALRQAEARLQSANRRKDEFLAMLAHELRNPLAPIRNASEYLARTLAQNRQIGATVEIVKRQVTHLTRLVDDLLDVSRITEGRIELQRAPLELSRVVAQAIESVEPLMREKRHTVLVGSTFEPLFVDGDHARLVQSVSNLLTNAAKYTDAGGEIRVDMRREAGRAVLVIADNGIGIGPELLPGIFELFVQGDRSLDRSQGGLGIGLSVVKRLIDMHQGEVSAASPGPGCGSTFRVSLPLIDAPSVSAEVPARTPARPRRILVVDDNADAADSLALILRFEGHDTEAVYGAKEALDRAAVLRPDVVLLDIGLPEMSGYEVARRLRRVLEAVQLVALTGYGQAEDVRRARAAGFDAHVIKPVDFQRLERILGAGAPLEPPRAH